MTGDRLDTNQSRRGVTVGPGRFRTGHTDEVVETAVVQRPAPVFTVRVRRQPPVRRASLDVLHVVAQIPSVQRVLLHEELAHYRDASVVDVLRPREDLRSYERGVGGVRVTIAEVKLLESITASEDDEHDNGCSGDRR